MKTNSGSILLLIALLFPVATGLAGVVHSTYTGPDGGNWNDAANWSPSIVPNNNGSQDFAVTLSKVQVVLNNLDVTINRLTEGKGDPYVFGGDAPQFVTVDQDFSSLTTRIGAGGDIEFFAKTKNLNANLGDLLDFSNNTLKTGFDYVLSADAGRTLTLQFQGANIEESNAGIDLEGPGTIRVEDENGADAFAGFRHHKLFGYLGISQGATFSIAQSFTNEGEIFVQQGRLTFEQDLTQVGFPLDPNTDGQFFHIAPQADQSARSIIKGKLTNYDPASKTLHKSYFIWEAANGGVATTKVLGFPSFDIVKSDASLNLYGPHTGFRDQNGNDALRNLAISSRFLIGNRGFTTAGSFISTGRLAVFGDCHFTVQGNLQIRNGFFEVSALSGYIREGFDGFPMDPAYLSSKVTVRENFNLRAKSAVRFDLHDAATPITVNVGDTATFDGVLQVGLDDMAQIQQSDTYKVLTADTIQGQFSNVASGQRVDAYAGFNGVDPLGDPVGSFLVTYDKTTLTLSDFQPTGGNANQPATGKRHRDLDEESGSRRAIGR